MKVRYLGPLFLLAVGLIFSSRVAIAQEPSLGLLFAEPTSAEIAAVQANWNARDVQPYNWQIVGSGLIAGLPTDVVSHTVSGDIHYGVVRYPQNYQPTEQYPVLVVNHGGTGGTSVGIVGGFSQDCLRDFFVIAPSFSGEPLDTGPIGLGVLTSEGAVSEFDGDIDDVLALLNGTIANYAGANAGNISVFGGSRGAGVSYLMSIRDPRIQRAVYFYGATDHMTYPELETIVGNLLAAGQSGNPFYNTVVRVAEPYMDGSLSLADARLALLSRSAIHFKTHLPTNFQIHHGALDAVVPVENSQLLHAALTANSLPSGAYTYYEYPDGGHGPNMPDSIMRRNEFLCVATTDTPTAVTYQLIEQASWHTNMRLLGVFVALLLLSLSVAFLQEKRQKSRVKFDEITKAP